MKRAAGMAALAMLASFAGAAEPRGSLSQLGAMSAGLGIGSHEEVKDVPGAPVVDGVNGAELCELMKGLPHGARDAAILALSAQSFAGMRGEDAACVLGLAQEKETYGLLPSAAWKAMKGIHLAAVLEAWGGARCWGDVGPGVQTLIIHLWLTYNPDGLSGGELRALFAAKAGRIDFSVLKIPLRVWSEASGADVAWVLNRIGFPETFDLLPDEAWRRMDRADLEALLQGWGGRAAGAAGSRAQARIMRLWIKARQAEAGK